MKRVRQCFISGKLLGPVQYLSALLMRHPITLSCRDLREGGRLGERTREKRFTASCYSTRDLFTPRRPSSTNKQHRRGWLAFPSDICNQPTETCWTVALESTVSCIRVYMIMYLVVHKQRSGSTRNSQHDLRVVKQTKKNNKNSASKMKFISKLYRKIVAAHSKMKFSVNLSTGSQFCVFDVFVHTRISICSCTSFRLGRGEKKVHARVRPRANRYSQFGEMPLAYVLLALD